MGDLCFWDIWFFFELKKLLLKFCLELVVLLWCLFLCWKFFNWVGLLVLGRKRGVEIWLLFEMFVLRGWLWVIWEGLCVFLLCNLFKVCGGFCILFFLFCGFCGMCCLCGELWVLVVWLCDLNGLFGLVVIMGLCKLLWLEIMLDCGRCNVFEFVCDCLLLVLFR